MSIQSMINFIKTKYATLHGKPIEKCSDAQICAVYYSLLKRAK